MDQSSNQAVEITCVPRFDVDDAFSDGEDDGGGFRFNPDAIREEFAKHKYPAGLSWPNEQEDSNVNSNKNGFFETQPPESDTSISTIDINGSGSVHAASSQSLSRPQTPEESSEHMSSQFSSVSLSDPPRQTHKHPEGEEHEMEDNYNKSEVPHDQAAASEESNNGADKPFSMVHIDASEDPCTRNELLNESPESLSSHLPVNRSPSPLDSNRSRSRSLHDSQTSRTPNWSPPAATASSSSSPTIDPDRGHRPSRSAGPSMMEKVVSKTRPTYLPPKSKQEDNKHLADWSTMMKQSRVAGVQR
jgi:hypothetical protein